jgi:hypothetical protein
MAAQTNAELIKLDFDDNEFEDSYGAELEGKVIIEYFANYFEKDTLDDIVPTQTYIIMFWKHKIRHNYPMGWFDVYWCFPQIDTKIKYATYWFPSKFGCMLRSVRRVVPLMPTLII